MLIFVVLDIFCEEICWFMLILLWCVTIRVDSCWFKLIWDWFMLIYVDFAMVSKDSCCSFIGSYWFNMNLCRFMLMSLWFVMIYIYFSVIYIDFAWIYIYSCWFCSDWWCFMLISVDAYWFCIDLCLFIMLILLRCVMSYIYFLLFYIDSVRINFDLYRFFSDLW